MKKQSLPKTLFALTTAISLIAFIAVNTHARLTAPHFTSSTETTQALPTDPEPADKDQPAGAHKIPMPDITLLARLYDLAQWAISK